MHPVFKTEKPQARPAHGETTALLQLTAVNIIRGWRYPLAVAQAPSRRLSRFAFT